MTKSAAERKQDQRKREERLGMKELRMNLAKSERDLIAERAQINNFEDQTEYLLSLVYKERDTSHIDALKAKIERLKSSITKLIHGSAGVMGLHQNGEIAYWDELQAGGRSEEWLLALNETPKQALSVVKAEAIKEAVEELTARGLEFAPSAYLDLAEEIRTS